MTSNLKCPFCGKQMKIGMLDLDDCMGTVWMSIMPCDCVCSYGASKAVWQALIQAKQDLEIVVDALKSAKKRFELINNSKFANLNNVLQIQSQCEILKINQALEQIEHKEKHDGIPL